MKFSIITVALNAGEKLTETVKSVLCQTCTDYEIIVKDGKSTDDSVEKLRNLLKEKGAEAEARVRIVEQEDHSIYEAMNQAIACAAGDYYLFLNCGDYLYEETVLEKTFKVLSEYQAVDIAYGDQFLRTTNCVVPSPKQLTDFTCYRNIPCHQVCFYKKRLFAVRGYDTNYPVRADYEHFLWCKYRNNAIISALPYVVTSYEGEGFSETKEHLKQARQEHRRITKEYIGTKCIFYKMAMIVTLQPLRKKMAESRKFSGFYQKVKKLIYKR